MVQPSTNTAVTSSSDRSASVSSPTLHSTVARRVRCRSGRSTAPVPSASSDAASRSSSAAGSSSRVRAAASSIASGRPSRRRQISATAASLPAVSSKSGRTARARSTNSPTAGQAATSPAETLPEPAGNASGGTGYSRSARSPSTVRLVATITTPGQRASSSPRSRATWSTCSRLSRISSHAPSPNVSASASTGGPVRAKSAPAIRSTATRASPGSVTASSGTNTVPAPNRSPSRWPTATRVLPTPPGPVSVTSRAPERSTSPATSSMARSRPSSDVVLTGSRRRPRAPAGNGAAAGGEPLAQQHRQIITHQPAQLGRSAEITVGGRGLLLDPGQQVSQARLAIGRRRLDIQQPGQPTRQLELLLQARDPRASGQLPVPLPVQPEEHIALRQVRTVHLGRRIRPGSRLEHHRGQPQRRSSTRNSPPLPGQLTQRGTHKHPQTPVRSPDDHLIPRPPAHRPPLIRPHHARLQPATPASKPRKSPTGQPAPAATDGQTPDAQ